MTRTPAVEWARYNSRVNAVAPDVFPTEGARSRLWFSEDAGKRIQQRIPVGRLRRPEEAVNLAAY